MAANISGASLSDIYDRLNAASVYHPLEAETFSDWSMEAGDIVTVTRGEEEYQSPVHTTRMVWKGTPQTTISASGKKARDSVAKVSQRKYGRGGGAMRNQQELHYDIYSEDGYIHSMIDVTASAIRTEVGQTISGMAHSIIEQTATYIRTEVENAASSISASVIEQTAEYVRTEVSSVASGVAWSVVEQTMTGIFQEVAKKSKVYRQWTDPHDGINVLYDGDIWVKVSDVRTWDDMAATTWDNIKEMHWNDMYGALTYVWKGNNATGHWELVHDEAPVVESNTWVEQSAERYAILARQVDLNSNVYESNLSVTAQKISSEVVDTKNELSSSISQTASQIRSEVSDTKNGLQSSITQTASQIRSEVSDTANGLQSSITQTASQIRSEVSDTANGLQSSITQTASQIRSEVSDTANGLQSSITQTASQIRSEVSDTKNGLQSSITQTASQIRSEVSDTKNGLQSSITQTASQIRSEVSNTKNGLQSSITQTASQIRSEVSSTANSLRSSITQTASQIRAEVSNADNSLRSSITEQANRISLVVEGTGANAKIRPAEIVASINAQTQSSRILLKADQINLSGYVKATDITADYLATKIATATNISVKKLTLTNNGYISLPTDGGSVNITGANAYDTIKGIKVVSAGNNQYKLQAVTYGDASWHDIPNTTFDRAVTPSLSGSWSNGTLRVTSNPSAANDFVETLVAGTASLSGTTYTVPINAQFGSQGQYSESTGWNVTVNASTVYSNGRAQGRNDVVINKGTWSSGQIAFTKSLGTGVGSGVKISAQYNGWSSGTYSVTIRDAYDSSSVKDTGYTVSVSMPSLTLSTTHSGTTIDPGSGHKNNSSGYYIISEGSSGRAQIGVAGTISGGGTSTTAYSYLETAPTNLYRHAYGQGYTAGQHSPTITKVRNFAAASGTTIDDVSWSNNSSGYHIISDGSSGEAGIIIGNEVQISGGTSQYKYNYLQSAPTNLYRYAYGKGHDAGLEDYYYSTYWKKPTDNNGVCLIPNKTNSGSDTWFSMSTITITNVGWHSTSGTLYYGKLYYWDDDDESYQPVYTSNAYWYRSAYRKSGATTYYY